MPAYIEGENKRIQPGFQAKKIKVLTLEYDDFSGDPHHSKLIDQARQASKTETAGTRHRSHYAIGSEPKLIEPFFLQLELVRSIEHEWKRDEKPFKPHLVYVDAKAAPDFDDVQEPALRCFRDYLDAYDPSIYCDGSGDDQNILGCYRAGLYEFGSPNLSQFGEMHGMLFHVNKNEVRKHVYTCLEKYRFCPILDLDTIETRIQELNTTINPRTNAFWEYVYKDGKTKGEPVGIQRVADKDKQKETKDAYADLPGCLRPVLLLALLGGTLLSATLGVLLTL
ncbi:MAG: hypothetical protein D6675_02830 [Gemmatimonadetes bacterium]|nr:MAG: hypothetical protein D6675_02830 [Gemmatimonadota bacterium]